MSYAPSHDSRQLPEPGPDALAHSARVAEHLRDEISRAGGFVPFARYMELALYAPGLGYYSAGAHKFGAAGDFITAPEFSPLFARCLARQCAEILRILGGGEVLELGAGSGVLAADLLAELDVLGVLPNRYRILEISADLRLRQEQTLRERVPQYADRVAWLEQLPEQGFTGIILGNEVLDALPVERFVKTEAGIAQLGVSWNGTRFDWQTRAASGEFSARVEALQAELERPFLTGYRSEYCQTLAPLLASLAGVLQRGVMLWLDYGLPRREYYHPERDQGTLRCHYRHRAHNDPFFYPGLQDITAWVDFTALAEAGIAAGLELLGYTTQAHFLLGAGLSEVMDAMKTSDTRAQLELAHQAKLLTLPDEMGEHFKAMALGRGLDLVPRGFALRDLSDSL